MIEESGDAGRPEKWAKRVDGGSGGRSESCCGGVHAATGPSEGPGNSARSRGNGTSTCHAGKYIGHLSARLEQQFGKRSGGSVDAAAFWWTDGRVWWTNGGFQWTNGELWWTNGEFRWINGELWWTNRGLWWTKDELWWTNGALCWTIRAVCWIISARTSPAPAPALRSPLTALRPRPTAPPRGTARGRSWCRRSRDAIGSGGCARSRGWRGSCLR